MSEGEPTMSGLVFACVAPHGFPIIPDLSDDADGAMATREAMFELGRRCAAANPDVIVVATPHGFRVDDTICLPAVARGAGTLFWGDRTVEMNIPVDIPLTDGIAGAARARGVPIAMAGYAGNRRDQSVIPLDWGVVTPLWFLGHGRNMVGTGHVLAQLLGEEIDDIGPPVVIATPSRRLPRQQVVEFGKAIAEAAARDGRRVAFVASCDWAHTHKESGPYGFHEDAAAADGMIVDALKDDDPGRLIDLPDERASNAAIDGLWQTLMLAGALEVVPMRGEVLSYEAPSYYGMIVASYEPVQVHLPLTNRCRE
jgi:aromatic ring-opening dioxygenase LigB subunit